MKRRAREVESNRTQEPQNLLPDLLEFTFPEPASEVEIALRERVKELNCLYTIGRLRELHFHSMDRFLNAVVDCLPRSWRYPEHACASITYQGKRYVTDPFLETRWRMTADLRVEGKPAGVVEVFYRKVVFETNEGPFLKEEYSLIQAVAERVGNVITHMKASAELREAHKALQHQHQMVQDANTALRMVLSRLEEEKKEIRASILANIHKILMPIVFDLELQVTGTQRLYVTLLRQSLQEIASPLLTEIGRNQAELTPVELAICTMMRNGLSTKEIAQLRSISLATVRRHRENIRRKLGLTNRKINLVTFLQSSPSTEAARKSSAGGPVPSQPA